MADITKTGFKSKVAFKLEEGSAYPASTPAVLGSGDLLPFRSESITTTKTMASNNFLSGRNVPQAPDKIALDNAGDVECDLKYDNKSLLTALICSLGLSPPNNSPQDMGGGAFDHFIELDQDIDVNTFLPDEKSSASNKLRQGTLGIDKGGDNIFEYLSSKVTNVTISGSGDADQPISISLGMLANKRDKNSVYNTSANTWTLGQHRCGVLFKQLVLRVRPVYEFTVAAANDAFVVLENAADTITIDVPDGTYSPELLAEQVDTLLTQGSSNSIRYKCTFDYCTRKFTIKNTNNTTTFTTVVASSQLHTTMGFESDASAALQITGQLGATYDNADLDSSDELAITDFSIEIPSNVFAPRDSSTDEDISEPVLAGMRELTGSFTVNRFKNNNFITGFDRHTRYFCDFRFTGGGISGDESYEFNILYPEIILSENGIDVSDESVISPTFSFMASDPVVDIAPGWEGTPTADSLLEKFLVVDSLDSTIDQIYQMAPFRGKIYAATGNTNGILMEYDKEDGWDQTFYDKTTEKTLTAVAFHEGENVLYIASRNDADNVGTIWTWDGNLPVTFTSVKAMGDVTVNTLHYSDSFGIVVAGIDDGDIFSSVDDFATAEDTGTFTDVLGFADGDGSLYACGHDAGDGLIRESTNGTSFSALVTYAGTGTSEILDIVFHDGYIDAGRTDSTDGKTLHRYTDADSTGVAMLTGITANPIELRWYNGWLYYVQGSELKRIDGFNSGSDVLVQDLVDTTAETMAEFDRKLFIGTAESGDASVFIRRPLQGVQITNKNTIAVNPQA